jgi:hypothetical protein
LNFGLIRHADLTIPEDRDAMAGHGQLFSDPKLINSDSVNFHPSNCAGKSEKGGNRGLNIYFHSGAAGIQYNSKMIRFPETSSPIIPPPPYNPSSSISSFFQVLKSKGRNQNQPSYHHLPFHHLQDSQLGLRKSSTSPMWFRIDRFVGDVGRPNTSSPTWPFGRPMSPTMVDF